MFGFPETPSPGISTALLESEEKAVELHVIACRPADLSTVPAEIRAKWAPLTPGWMTDNCESCNCAVHVSAGQIDALMAADGRALILCMVHAAMLTFHPDVDTSGMVIHRIGA